MQNTGQFAGKVAVVTGGARAMGRAHAEGFLAAGAKVVALDVSWKGAEAFRAELDANPNALALDMDITIDAQIDKGYEATLAKFGTTDILVNNAALLNLGPQEGLAGDDCQSKLNGQRGLSQPTVSDQDVDRTGLEEIFDQVGLRP